jgi:hypothetical protein
MVVLMGGLLVELGRRVAVVALLDAGVLQLGEGVEDAGAGVARLIVKTAPLMVPPVPATVRSTVAVVMVAPPFGYAAACRAPSARCNACRFSSAGLPQMKYCCWTKDATFPAPPQVGKLAPFDNRT